VTSLAENAMSITTQPGRPCGSLTDRELQVLAYQTTPLTRADICQEIGMSPRMLQRHTTSITSKLSTGHQHGATSDTDAGPDDSSWPFS
jgi:DNA-binding NarL/FixJ family response regulator